MKAILFFMEDNQKSFFSDINVWRDTAFAFNIDCYIIVDETSGKEFAHWSDQYKESHVTNSIEEALNIHPELTKVWLKQNGEITLQNFQHPEDDVVYIFGPDDHPIDIQADYQVRIDVERELWAIQACSIVLYDRNSKLQ